MVPAIPELAQTSQDGSSQTWFQRFQSWPRLARVVPARLARMVSGAVGERKQRMEHKPVEVNQILVEEPASGYP